MPTPSPYAQRLAGIPVREHDVDIFGTTAAYWEYGRPDADTVIVAVHGFRGEHHGLEPVVAYLPDARIIMPDLPGFGQTPPMPDRRHDIAAYAQWLTAFVETVAPRAVVLGHSFGSIVASAAVAEGLQAPALILVNPIGAPALEGPKGALTRLAVAYYRAGAALPARWGTALLRSRIIVRMASLAMVTSSDPAIRRFAHDQHDRYFSSFSDRDVLSDAFLASVSHDVREFAPRISIPTLLIAAQKDQITPIAAERRLATLFAYARLHEIADVGHLIHYEAPVEAAGAIRRFLRALAGQGR